MPLMRDLRRVAALLHPERFKYSLGLASLFLVNASDVAAPLFLAVAVDLTEAALTGNPPGTPQILATLGLETATFSLLGAIALYLSLQVLANVMRYPMLMFSAVPSHQIAQGLRNHLVDHLLRLSQPFYDRAKSGDLMSRATADINATRMMLGPGILVGTDTLFLFGMVLLVLFGISWQLTLIAMIPLPLIGIVTNKLSHIEYQRFEAVQEDIGALTERSRESYAGIRILQGYAREDHDRARFAEHSLAHYAKNLRLARVRAVFDPTLDLFIGLSQVLVLVFGGLRVVDGSLSLGSFVAFLFLVSYLSGPMIGFGWAVSLFQRGRASLHRLDDLFDEPIDIADPKVPRETRGQGHLRLSSLTYAYTPEDTPALCDIEIEVHAGQTLGVIGSVGAGKSTLARLLTRLYDPPPQTVFLDHVDVRDLRLDALRQAIVMAPQDTFLFSDTVARNVALSRHGDDVVHEAARLAQIHEEIEALPETWDTMLGERGVNLSGGQRQRLAIARAIACDPSVLVLDDCLSAVDARTEEAILDSLQIVFEGRTGVIISHRVCAVKRCDHIVLLDAGRILEQGTHAELIELDGEYADIARRQSLEEVPA